MYETQDVEERNMTVALHDLFLSIAESGATCDPLSLISRSVVRCVPDIEFAFYAYDDEETGQIAAIKEGSRIWLPSPDIQRRYVAHLRKCVERTGIAVEEPEVALSFLPPAQRKKWICHRCCVIRVRVAGCSPAILAAFVRSDFAITVRHQAWMRLFGDAAVALLSRHRAAVNVQSEKDQIVQAKRDLALEIESSRERVRQHLQELEKVWEEYLAGSVSLKEAMSAVVRSAKTLYALSNITTTSEASGMPEFNDAALEKWVCDGMRDSRIKAVVGVRGANKSAILQAIRSRVLASGVNESHVVTIDFEDARFRKFKTANDVIDYLSGFPSSKNPYYLFMDEVGMIGYYAELLRRLSASARWNVWLATSSVHPVLPAKEGAPFSVFRAWTNLRIPRSRGDLEKIWCQIFMRDIVSGIDHPDLRAKELLAEYYSDHLGEVKSLRDIVEAFKSVDYPLSRSTISTYRQALVDAYLIEISEIYDVFAEEVVKSVGGRAFYTDLELRNWRFGAAGAHDETRVALNRLYLELRQKYDKVYTPKDSDADFVTINSHGKPCLWSLSPDKRSDVQFFGQFLHLSGNRV